MTERFDVVIVGARAAGSPLGALLARRGLKVAVLEQVTFPRDTLSSHVIQADAISFLDRLGVIDAIRATGAPLTEQIDARLDDLRFTADLPRRPGDVGGGACIRRHVLDPILADAAAGAGVDLRMDTKVTGLIEEDGRVVGVRAQSGGQGLTLRADLVVGADGRASTVAKLRSARRYNVVPNERSYYWTYYEGADLSTRPTFVFHRWGDRFVIAAPADSGLYMVGVSPEATERDAFRRDRDSCLTDHAQSCEPVAAAIAGARRATKIFGIVHFNSYFRESSGPGWVLVGDAGHFKDPAAGRGIGDAFLQVDRLAPTITDCIDLSPLERDRALAEWAHWRDREFADHYWLGVDFGRAGALPAMVPELLRIVRERGATDRFVEILSHRSSPSEVLTRARVVEATGRLLVRRGHRRRGVLLRELGTLGAEDVRRRWVARHPVLESPSEPRPAPGATTVSPRPAREVAPV